LSVLCLQCRERRLPRSREIWWSFSDHISSETYPERIIRYKMEKRLWHQSHAGNRLNLFSFPKGPYSRRKPPWNAHSRTQRERVVHVRIDQTIEMINWIALVEYSWN
jgi:hypothetical protein